MCDLQYYMILFRCCYENRMPNENKFFFCYYADDYHNVLSGLLSSSLFLSAKILFCSPLFKHFLRQLIDVYFRCIQLLLFNSLSFLTSVNKKVYRNYECKCKYYSICRILSRWKRVQCKILTRNTRAHECQVQCWLFGFISRKNRSRFQC